MIALHRLASLPPGLLLLASASSPARAQTSPPSPPLPLRLAVQTEAAGGGAPGPFYNHLLGGRLDGRFSPHISLGGYLGYANLKGKDGRVGAALAYAQLEYLAGDP